MPEPMTPMDQAVAEVWNIFEHLNDERFDPYAVVRAAAFLTVAEIMPITSDPGMVDKMIDDAAELMKNTAQHAWRAKMRVS